MAQVGVASCALVPRRGLMSVLVDMHGVPGSQNGADHSGCEDDGIGWSAATMETTLLAVEAVVKRYGQLSSFMGIELMNEPAWKVEWEHGVLLEYYTRALALVRSISSEALVVFNVLYWDAFPAGFGDWWDGQLTGHNVVIDLHLYDCYGDASQKSVDDHMAQAQAWAQYRSSSRNENTTTSANNITHNNRSNCNNTPRHRT